MFPKNFQDQINHGKFMNSLVVHVIMFNHLVIFFPINVFPEFFLTKIVSPQFLLREKGSNSRGAKEVTRSC